MTLPDGRVIDLDLGELERAARNTNHRRAEVWTEDVCLALIAAVRRADERVREERAIAEEVARRFEADPHYFGTRPCPTCRDITESLGRDFGCVARAAIRNRSTQ